MSIFLVRMHRKTIAMGRTRMSMKTSGLWRILTLYAECQLHWHVSTTPLPISAWLARVPRKVRGFLVFQRHWFLVLHISQLALPHPLTFNARRTGGEVLRVYRSQPCGSLPHSRKRWQGFTRPESCSIASSSPEIQPL